MIATAAFNLVASAVLLNNPTIREMAAASGTPLPVQYAMIGLGVTMFVVSGVGMLRGHNWGRWLYVTWTAAGIAIDLATTTLWLALVPSIAAYLVVVFFLFRPAPNEYFAAESAPDAQGV
jgi:hypothetical protein